MNKSNLSKYSWESVCFPTKTNDGKKQIQDKNRNELKKVPFMNSVAMDQLNNKHIPPNAYTYPYADSELLKKYSSKILSMDNSNLNFSSIDGAPTDIPKFQEYNQFMEYTNDIRLEEYYKNIEKIKNKNMGLEHFNNKNSKKSVPVPSEINTFPLGWTCYESNGKWICPLRGDKVE